MPKMKGISAIIELKRLEDSGSIPYILSVILFAIPTLVLYLVFLPFSTYLILFSPYKTFSFTL